MARKRVLRGFLFALFNEVHVCVYVCLFYSFVSR